MPPERPHGRESSFEPPEHFNIAEYFLHQRIQEGRGGRIALRLDEQQLTYLDVRNLTFHWARRLRQAGIRQEDRVMIALPDGPDWVGAFFGILHLGAVVVMVNPQLDQEGIQALIDYTRVRGLVTHPSVEETFRAAAAVAPGLLTEETFLTSADESADETADEVPGTGAAEGPGSEIPIAETHRDDPAIWLFSGGTTGRPKAVIQTHRSFANTTELYAKKALRYHEDDITLSVPKLYFGYATGSNLLFPFAVGASVVLFDDHPSPEVLFEKIARHRPTILINVPTLVNRMVRHPAAAAQDLSCLRFATSAGEALPGPLYHRWKETFGVELLDGLGTAEMWHIFVSNVPGAVKPGTLGQVIPGFEIEVRDDEGHKVADGDIGRLWVRGDSRAISYWQNMPKTQEAFRGDWFVGGDLVCRDAEGYISYCGRSDDVLKVGGKWLVPQEVESCLLRHPSVKECAVVGVEDKEGLMKPYAFVLVNENAADDLEEQLKTFALENLQAYKHPRRVILLEEFPRTHLGKVDRGKLKAKA